VTAPISEAVSSSPPQPARIKSVKTVFRMVEHDATRVARDSVKAGLNLRICKAGDTELHRSVRFTRLHPRMSSWIDGLSTKQANNLFRDLYRDLGAKTANRPVVKNQLLEL